MKTYTATVTSKGQITIPVELRRYLGLEESGKVTLSVTDDGTVELRRSRYPDLKSLRGAAGSLDRVMDWNEMIAIAREDALAAELDTVRE